MRRYGYENVLTKVLKWLEDNKDLWENNPERYRTLFESRLRLHALTDYAASNCLAEYQTLGICDSEAPHKDVVSSFLAA